MDWKPGEAKWSPAGGMHIAEITSDKPVDDRGSGTEETRQLRQSAGEPLDPVKLDPKSYKVELENDQVRVLRVKIDLTRPCRCTSICSTGSSFI